jgi:hypothetical protein
VVRGKANKSKETVESEDEAAEDKPANKKAKKDDGAYFRVVLPSYVLPCLTTLRPADSSSETVKTWRHRLQKAFLAKDKAIRPEVRPYLVFASHRNADFLLGHARHGQSL